MNKKKKSTNTSPYPDEVIDSLARAFYPAILACWNSEEGQREFAVWQAEQAHHTTSKEKQSVPDGECPVVPIAYCLWSLAGCVRLGAPCFCFAFDFLTHGSRLRFSNIPSGRHSESSPHSSVGSCRQGIPFYGRPLEHAQMVLRGDGVAPVAWV